MKKKIEEIIVGGQDVGASPSQVAAEIAKQVVSRDEYEAETAILGNRVFKAEARLAVITEALQGLQKWGLCGVDELRFEVQEKAEQALSAAPKVLWSEQQTLFVPVNIAETHLKPSGFVVNKVIGKDSQQVTVYVVADKEE